MPARIKVGKCQKNYCDLSIIMKIIMWISKCKNHKYTKNALERGNLVSFYI